MPRKRGFVAPNIDHIHSQSSQRDLASSPSTRTVNDRIAQLRAEQAPRPTIEQRRQIETIVTTRSMPPDLSNILAIPMTAGPTPRPGSTAHHRLLATLRRGPPGPSAPRSWLNSRHASPCTSSRAGEGSRANQEKLRHRPSRFCQLSKLEGPHAISSSRSLIDQTLKIMAINWEFIVEYEQYNLATIPVWLKSVLLSYLSVYGPDEGISLEGLRTLFLTEKELADATGSQELTRLDLTGLLTGRFSLGELIKFFVVRPRKASQYAGSSKGANTIHASPYEKDDASSTEISIGLEGLTAEAPSPDGTALDSWEEAAEVGVLSIPSALNHPRFPSLARLSLANAGTYASWPKLLSLSSHLSTLTHLSLAYWPQPSTDWHEARSILRRLSNNTYCLQWLDIEGCSEWLRQLTPSEAEEMPHFTGHQPNHFDDFVATQTDQGADWNGSWAQVKYVNVSQGLIPINTRAIRAMPAGVIACDLLLYLRENDDLESGSEMQNVEQWIDQEKAARRLATSIRLARNSVKGQFCVFDHGWIPPRAVVIRKEDKLAEI